MKTPRYRPSYHVSTTIDDKVVGEFMAPIPDPLARTTVTVGWRDLLRSLLTRRTLTVTVTVGADSRTATRLLELDPDYLGPAGSPSRKAWDAALHERLGSLAHTPAPRYETRRPCPVCGRMCFIVRVNTLKKHVDRDGKPCPGSGHSPDANADSRKSGETS